MKPTIGQKVTTIVARDAFYSEYAGNPKCTFEPGDIGTVAVLDVPAVRPPVVWIGDKKTYPYGREPVYACVDFERYGQMWRVNLYYKDIR
jgi:hypothetical protein